MIVYAEVECHIYNTHSLKDKRSVIKRLIAKIRKDFNVSISEIDFQDLWQRTKLAIVTVANELLYAEKIIQEVIKMIDNDPELERTITTIDRL
ncbi:DUF503 domain-containing protein [Pseudogracilibacillus sp. SE30717A]|uniref:DUF503 domain-containing protein n=1 Tax=Pseudogracilibacillus sp. SE30717A TaxID=3098293 RepID=UPI00300DD531